MALGRSEDAGPEKVQTLCISQGEEDSEDIAIVEPQPLVVTKKAKAEGGDVYIKWAALGILLFQNTGTNLVMPLAQRTEWNSQSGVVNQELIKGVACVGALLWGGGAGGVASSLRPTAEALKTSIPAMIYFVQNNMQYVAAKRLDPTAFAVLYQLKILFTAVLSVLLLKRQISCVQWMALLLLLSGAVTMVLSKMRASGPQAELGGGDISIGVAAVLFSCFLSGCAGVYFEKLLKGSTVTLAARNLQLSGYSLFVGLITFHQSGGDLSHFCSGYTPMVWVAILNNAVGGLLVAAVIKYADNIAKNFANTSGIICTSFVHWTLLGGSLGVGTLAGVVLVVGSIFLYAGLCSREEADAVGRIASLGSEAQEAPEIQKFMAPASQAPEARDHASAASPQAHTVGSAAV